MLSTRLCLAGDAESTGFATPTGDAESTGDAEPTASDRSMRDSVAIVLAQTAIDVRNSPDAIVSQLARQAIAADFGGEKTDLDVHLLEAQKQASREDEEGAEAYRQEPLNTEDGSSSGGGGGPKKQQTKIKIQAS